MAAKIVFLGWEQDFTKSVFDLCNKHSDYSKKTKIIVPNVDTATNLAKELIEIENLESLSLNQFCAGLIKGKPANTIIRIFTWQKILTETETLTLQKLFPGEFKYGKTNLFNLARRINELSETVLSCDQDFGSIYKICREKKIDNEAFWFELEILFSKYINLLNTNGYVDVKYEIKNTTKFESNGELLILAGCHNLSPQQEKIVNSLADAIIAIYAPSSHQAGFNEQGSLITNYWESIYTEINDNNLHFCETENEELFIATNVCQSEKPVSICILEKDLIKLFEANLNKFNINYKNNLQLRITNNKFIKLLIKIIDFSLNNSSENLAKLFRDPFIRNSYINSNSLITEFNNIRSNYFPEKLSLNCEILKNNLKQHTDLINKLEKITNTFINQTSIELAITKLINELELQIDEDDTKCLSILLENSAKIDDSKLNINNLASLKEIITLLSYETATLESKNTILSINNLPLVKKNKTIILGTSDDNLPNKEIDIINKPLAKVIKLNNFSISNSAYLINYLNQRNYDYVIYNSKSSYKNETKIPSRFLFKNKNLNNAERILKFINAKSNFDLQNSHLTHNFKLPDISKSNINRISVSSLKDYITCPYLFYLRHVLKLSNSSDRNLEMDALVFGKLAHLILENFSKLITNNSSSLEKTFDIAYQETIDAYFPWPTYPVINLQLEQLRERVSPIKHIHKNLTLEGWETIEIEKKFEQEITVNNQTVKLVGKIDRVDFNKSSNTLRVIDFKTSDKNKYFREIFKDNQWTDLQLPLYASWLINLHKESNIEICYINFPKGSSDIDILRLEQSHFELTKNQTEAVISNIVSNNFSPAKIDQWDNYYRNSLGL